MGFLVKWNLLRALATYWYIKLNWSKLLGHVHRLSSWSYHSYYFLFDFIIFVYVPRMHPEKCEYFCIFIQGFYLFLWLQARDAAMAEQGKMVDHQRKKSKGGYLPSSVDLSLSVDIWFTSHCIYSSVFVFFLSLLLRAFFICLVSVIVCMTRILLKYF